MLYTTTRANKAFGPFAPFFTFSPPSHLYQRLSRGHLIQQTLSSSLQQLFNKNLPHNYCYNKDYCFFKDHRHFHSTPRILQKQHNYFSTFFNKNPNYIYNNNNNNIYNNNDNIYNNNNNTKNTKTIKEVISLEEEEEEEDMPLNVEKRKEIEQKIQEALQKYDYKDTLKALESLILVNAPHQRAKDVRQTCNVQAMKDYLRRLEVDYNRLRFIHVAGTKGKGSTCAFCESILRSGFSLKTGLFTSPHMIDVRERIRINGVPISKKDFTRVFWECWYYLENTKNDMFPSMATYFRFLTLMGFKYFLEQKVDVAIIEVGLGGRLDATNVIENPIVCGITSIGYDHVDILGDTIEKIAFEKAGIMKKNTPVFTYQQRNEVYPVFASRAQEVGSPLYLIPPLSAFPILNGDKSLELALDSEPQKLNAALALVLSEEFLKRCNYTSHDHQTLSHQIITTINTSPLKLIPTKLSSSSSSSSSSSIELSSSSLSSSSIGLSSSSLSSSSIELSSSSSSESSLIHIKAYPPILLSNQLLGGLSTVKWPCRGQSIAIHEYHMLFFIDGAHTDDSIKFCSDWFLKNSLSSSDSHVKELKNGLSKQDLQYISDDEEYEVLKKMTHNFAKRNVTTRFVITKRILIFYYTGNRSPESLLKPLTDIHLEQNQLFDTVIFCMADSNSSKLSNTRHSTSSNLPAASTTPQQTLSSLSSLSSSSLSSVSTFYKNDNGDHHLHDVSNVFHEKDDKEMQKLKKLEEMWKDLTKNGKRNEKVMIIPRIDNVLEYLCSTADDTSHTHVLVTGSFYLAGDFLRKLSKMRKALNKTE